MSRPLPMRSNPRVLGSLRGKASDGRSELADLTTKYGSRHPAVITARAQLGDIDRQIGAEAKRIVISAENEFQGADSRREFN